MPGGTTRSILYFTPYPLYIENAKGCKLYDVDSHELIDFLNCATAAILGHAHPKVVAAVTKQLNKFTVLSAPAESLNQWAELMCSRVDSVDKICFCNSGTEAVMGAVRAAREYTGKDKLVKTEGCYHGSYDPVLSEEHTVGVPRSTITDTFIVPYNNKEQAASVIRKHKDELAAVIVEGLMGSAGMIPPKDDYLSFLRKVTSENDVLLILDEVMSFRLDWGGAQHIYSIKPDLTAFGKIIGGGFPVGAFGGREDIMQIFSPEGGKISRGGTFNGNPITAVAGIATLTELTAEVINRLNHLGETLAQGIRDVFSKLQINAQVTGIGSLMSIHLTPEHVVDASSSRTRDDDLMHLLHLALIERGIFMARKGYLCTSTPMTEKEVDLFINAVGESMAELKPLFEQVAPHLL